MQAKLVLLIAVGGVTFIVTRIRRGDTESNKKRSDASSLHNNHPAQQQDAEEHLSEPSTSGSTPVILTSATTSAITTLMVMTVRDHAALPTPQALQRLVSLLQQQLRTVDNAAVAVLLIMSLTLMLVLGTQGLGNAKAWSALSIAPAPVSHPRPTIAALDALSGVWIKDGAASDSMEEAMDAVALNGMLRLAVRLIKGMELTVTEDTFTMSMLTVFSWYKVTEHYALDGTPSSHRRRDLRRGRHTGSVVVASGERMLELRLQWDNPFGGVEVDRFTLEGSDRLVVETSMSMDSGRAVAYKTVYARKR